MAAGSTTRGRRRLGPDFGRLWTAGTVSALGDGISFAAGPLLVASRTNAPVLVAGAAFLQELPWLLFSLPAGAYVDRLDRRKLLVAVNLLRAAAIGGLSLTVAAGAAALPVIYLLLFVLGVGDTLALNAGGALLPSLVGEPDLVVANARLYGAQTLCAQLLGPPAGAALFVLAPAAPFGLDAASFVLAALLITRIVGRPAAAADHRVTRLRHEIREGLGWLLQHRALRLVAVCICVMNLTFGGTMAVYVLYARQQLGLGAQGFGLLLSVSAVGGLAGTRLAAPLQLRFGIGALLRAGLLVEAATQLVLGLARSPWVAGAAMLAFGVHATVWTVVTVSQRQSAVPPELRGRINGVYFLFSAGGMAVGSLLGGLVAHALGIAAPYLLAAGVVALLAASTWRAFGTPGQGWGPPAGLAGATR